MLIEICICNTITCNLQNVLLKIFKNFMKTIVSFNTLGVCMNNKVAYCIQCHFLSCCPWHGGQPWQPLTAQIPANQQQYPPLQSSLQFITLQKKNNHLPYNMRCWKCCPLSSTRFWYLFRKCVRTWINSSSEIHPILYLKVTFNSCNM